MGLSRVNSFDSLQAAAEMASALAVLSDPKALKKALEELAGFSAIQDKAAQAREDIKKSEALKKACDESTKAAQAITQANTKAAESIAIQRAELKAEQENSDAKAKALLDERKALDAYSADLKKLAAALDKREADIVRSEDALAKQIEKSSAYEADLKAKAAQLRGLTEGL